MDTEELEDLRRRVRRRDVVYTNDLLAERDLRTLLAEVDRLRDQNGRLESALRPCPHVPTQSTDRSQTMKEEPKPQHTYRICHCGRRLRAGERCDETYDGHRPAEAQDGFCCPSLARSGVCSCPDREQHVGR